MKERVVVAMSGGVDSSIAAALLLERGYEVIGISMQLWNLREDELAFDSCCSPRDIEDARWVAHRLGFPFYVVNFEKEFQREVVEYFAGEYLRGRTPNPCIPCNERLKFRWLLKKALELGAERVATGHYTRLLRVNGSWSLRRGLDPKKDQTYFLFNLKQEQLSRALFPLGELRKGEVRARARAFGLKVAEKGESQEICFIPRGGHASFLKERFPEAFRPGAILDEAGELLGTHPGLPHFTVGQRRGLGLSSRRPLYVLKLDPEMNTLTVGPRESLRCEGFIAEGVSWTLPPHPYGREALVQVRYRRAAKPAYLKPLDGNRVEVEFLTPEEAVAPGQAAAFFERDLLLGGGWISR